MIDTHPCATPVPAQPVATATSTEAPFPPADPLPHAVAPAVTVTDPISNLDFLPVDDAFAMELRSETIEQLVGGDALRRGESERIEAGCSQTNADLVAGRDRVRVHGSLHEHTGHGLAEVAAHLHTTVDGVLDVHAGNEDTVLLAGHMSNLWNGGTAIVAAMTDDTAAGGGIRVTTPLDLWVHGLMGVEERIGTCTADAVLMESGATHYEREYGPGVHAAGLAVYAGSLYQSSRSTFRPLMRVSSGVRNLIAAGDGGGGGGGAGNAPAASPPPASAAGGAGSDAGAGSAPGASPPPVPARTGAAAQAITRALAAGRRAVEAPATTLDAADGLAGARRAALEELVNPVDARVAEEMGEAGTVMRAEDLPELTRCAGTAGRLGALRETLRMDAAASGSETAGGFRASEFERAVSMHPAGGGGGPLETTPPSAVYGENAPMARPHPGASSGQGPAMKPELLGGADRPPQSAAPESDFPAVNRRLRELRGHNFRLYRTYITRDCNRVLDRFSKLVLRRFTNLGGNTEELAPRSGITKAELAYLDLQKTARQAERDGEHARADEIREALDAIDKRAVEALQALTTKHGIPEVPSTQAVQQPPAAAEPTATVTAIPPPPPPAHTPIRFDWATAYGPLRDLARQFSSTGQDRAYADFRLAADQISKFVRHRFGKVGGDTKHLPPRSRGGTTTEQEYRAIQDMLRGAEESDNATRADAIRQVLEEINQHTARVWDELARKYGAHDFLVRQATQTMQASRAMQDMYATQVMRTMQRPPPTAGSSVTVASTTVAFTGRLNIPGPPHPTVLTVNPAFPLPAGGLVNVTDVPGPPPASSLPGPSFPGPSFPGPSFPGPSFPGPSLSEAAGAQARVLWRGWFDPPATVPGATAAHPAATETIVTPSLGETSPFWPQPVNPVPAPGIFPFDIGPVLSRGAPFPTPSRVDDNFAGELPQGFDASRLIAEGGMFPEFGLDEELAAGRLPPADQRHID